MENTQRMRTSKERIHKNHNENVVKNKLTKNARQAYKTKATKKNFIQKILPKKHFRLYFILPKYNGKTLGFYTDICNLENDC